MASRRLRVLAFLLLAYVGALLVIWTLTVTTRQYQVLATTITSLVALLAALAWIVVSSGLSRRSQIRCVLALIGVALVGVLLFRLDVTGDLRPILR